MKYFKTIFLILSCILIYSCTNDGIDFTYSPTEPKAGESVSFTNLTKDGDKWAWTFGDGSESSTKHPTKTFRRAGTYTVTLQVDKKKYKTVSKTITVYDSIPNFSVSADSIVIYENITLNALIYNPFGYDVTYQWTLPDDAIIVSGDLDEATLTVYFTKIQDNAQIKLDYTLGSKNGTITKSYSIYGAKSQNLWFITNDKRLYRQPIFSKGTLQPIEITIDKDRIANLTNLAIQGDSLFIFNAAQGDKSLVSHVNLNNLKTTDLIKVSDLTQSSFNSAIIANNNLYWIIENKLYSTSLPISPFTITSSTEPIYQETRTDKINSIAYCSGRLFMATAHGLMAFNLSTNQAVENVLLNEFDISKIDIDQVAKKLYFITNTTLYVSNLDGSNTNKLLDAVNAIHIDNINSLIFCATSKGVLSYPLIQNRYNSFDDYSTELNDMNNVNTLLIDTKQRQY